MDRAGRGIRDLIRYYTREAGVRSLERELGALARKTVRDMARENVTSITIEGERLAKYAGVRKLPLRRDGRGGPEGHRHGPGLDRVRRRHPDHRGGQDAGQGSHDRHRQPEGRDEGVHLRGGTPTSAPGRPPSGSSRPVRQDRRPRPRARRRHAQGRSVRRRGHGHGHRLGADRHSHPQGPGHDRRGHPAGPGHGHRRPEGEAAGGAALGRHDGADPAARTRRIWPRCRRT